MRVLHTGLCDGFQGLPRRTSPSDLRRSARGAGRQSVPLRDLYGRTAGRGDGGRRNNCFEEGRCVMAEEKWPAADQRSLIGKRISRLDGPWKASGRAKYSYDVNRPGMLFGKMVISPHAHAKVVSIDTSAAEKVPGFRAAQVIVDEGREVLWAGQEVVAVAADTEEHARDRSEERRVGK